MFVACGGSVHAMHGCAGRVTSLKMPMIWANGREQRDSWYRVFFRRILWEWEAEYHAARLPPAPGTRCVSLEKDLHDSGILQRYSSSSLGSCRDRGTGNISSATSSILSWYSLDVFSCCPVLRPSACGDRRVSAYPVIDWHCASGLVNATCSSGLLDCTAIYVARTKVVGWTFFLLFKCFSAVPCHVWILFGTSCRAWCQCSACHHACFLFFFLSRSIRSSGLLSAAEVPMLNFFDATFRSCQKLFDYVTMFT